MILIILEIILLVVYQINKIKNNYKGNLCKLEEKVVNAKNVEIIQNLLKIFINNI